MAAGFLGCGGAGDRSGDPSAADRAAHDEAHPIAGNFTPDGTRIEDCDGDFRCLEQALGNLAYDAGPKPAIRVFDRMMQRDGAVEGNCHRIVHSISSASLARYEGNVDSAV